MASFTSTSSFPLDAAGRHILPPPMGQSSSAPIAIPELFVSDASVRSPVSSASSQAHYSINHHSLALPMYKPSHGHRRTISTSTSMSSLVSDDIFSSHSSGSESPTTIHSPSSSRCPSPSQSPKRSPKIAPSSGLSSSSITPQPQFSLVPRGKPFPENISLSDIEPTDALLYFPDEETAPTRAILLVGPAIARHVNQQRLAASSGAAPIREKRSTGSMRMHPYRIVANPARGSPPGTPCGISQTARDSSRRSNIQIPPPPSKWAEWAQGTSRTSRELKAEWAAIMQRRGRFTSLRRNPSNKNESDQSSADSEADMDADTSSVGTGSDLE